MNYSARQKAYTSEPFLKYLFFDPATLLITFSDPQPESLLSLNVSLTPFFTKREGAAESYFIFRWVALCRSHHSLSLSLHLWDGRLLVMTSYFLGGFFCGLFCFFFYFLKQFFFLYDTSYRFIEAAAFKQKTINKVRLKVQDSSASMLFAAVTYYQRKKKAFIKK